MSGKSLLGGKRDLVEVLLVVCAVSLVALGSATLVFTVLALRAVRRYVELAEGRMELLREGQARIFSLLADGRRASGGGAEAAFERGLEDLREARRRIPVPAVAAGTSEARRPERGPEGGGRGAANAPSAAPAGFPDTATSRKKKPPAAGKKRAPDGPPDDAKPLLGVRHPHPDDGAAAAVGPPAKEPPEPGARPRSSSGGPIEMFRKHYDRYLENYEGYVELAESLRRHRAPEDEAETPLSPSEEREREARLRRVEEGIARTVARLDILEGLNPVLAADDRVSRRALVAGRHAELGASS